MASAGNLFETMRKAIDLRTKEITSSSTVTTYTIRTGGTTYNFIEDAVVEITTGDGCDLAIALPDGTYLGQKILIKHVVDGGSSTITVTASTGSGGDSTLDTAEQYMYVMWIGGTTGWIALSESVAS